ncbi:MAG: A24 family peptidase [Pseudomonadota bacterium]
MDTDVFAQLPWMFPLAALLFGLLVGSFLNVVIYRLPVMMQRSWDQEMLQWQAERAGTELPDASSDSVETAVIKMEATATAEMEALEDVTAVTPTPVMEPFNLATPASACPACGHQIRAYENIPIISYLFLRGRCSNCGTKIGIRYPLVELFTGLATLAVALHFGPGWEAMAAAIFTWFLIGLSGIDIDHQLLPDSMTLLLLWIGLALSLFDQPTATTLFIEPRAAIAGAVIGYGLLWSVYHAFLLLTGKHGMGHGDFKLLAALGAWLGWESLPLIILLSALAGTLWGVLMIVSRRQQANQTMPFGPWLAAAGWVALVAGAELTEWYFGLVGISS